MSPAHLRHQGPSDPNLYYLCNWNVINIKLCTSDVEKMATGFICLACGETKCVQRCSGQVIHRWMVYINYWNLL